MRSGLRMILETDPDIEVVGEAADGAQAVAEATALRPDVVLLDVRMPGMDGVAAAWELARLPVRVLVLTTYDHDEYVRETLRAGARGFVLKSQRPEEILLAVKAVAQGQAALAPSTTLRLIETLRAAAPPPPGEPLTDREREVLALLAQGETTRGIAGHLSISQTTANTHVQHILRKLGANSRLRAVAVARALGLI
ncbi:hypothetical protein BKM31_12845 [[Actinomadura] parvosata subsp. kistnae]|uniref:DNA-binding response regulator n=2 Tax=Nonomuraea TaxID=83681 RepID=A0A1V0AJI1_9ACTN|nr:hypothetical protein BKM31_12845 [Nonomuraea sp. ATCC 55076]